MTVSRGSLESVMHALRLPVSVDPPIQGAQVSTYPVLLGGLESAQVEKKLDDIAGRLAVDSVRGGWIPGSTYYSLEVPKQPRTPVEYSQITVPKGKILPLLLGVTAQGNKAVVDDLTRLPHLLMAGQTGSGKSNAVHVMLATLITYCKPSQLRLVLCDPKEVELKPYEGIPHLLAPVLTESQQLVEVLEALIAEMQKRYNDLAALKVRDVASYNQKADKPLPRIVCVIDELADVMTVSRKDVEPLLQRLLAQGRACGIHLILSTQRVTDKVFTTDLKINAPARFALTCDTFYSSRAILDADGAQRLLGAGDAIYKAPDGPMYRVQNPFITDDNISAAIEKASQMKATKYKLASYQPQAKTPAFDEKMSPEEKTLLLIKDMEYVNSGDLRRADIVKDKKPAQVILRHLCAQGYVGEPDGNKRGARRVLYGG